MTFEYVGQGGSSSGRVLRCMCSCRARGLWVRRWISYLSDTLAVLATVQNSPGNATRVLALEEEGLGFAVLETEDLGVSADVDLALQSSNTPSAFLVSRNDCITTISPSKFVVVLVPPSITLCIVLICSLLFAFVSNPPRVALRRGNHSSIANRVPCQGRSSGPRTSRRMSSFSRLCCGCTNGPGSVLGEVEGDEVDFAEFEISVCGEQGSGMLLPAFPLSKRQGCQSVRLACTKSLASWRQLTADRPKRRSVRSAVPEPVGKRPSAWFVVLHQSKLFNYCSFD